MDINKLIRSVETTCLENWNNSLRKPKVLTMDIMKLRHHLQVLQDNKNQYNLKNQIISKSGQTSKTSNSPFVYYLINKNLREKVNTQNLSHKSIEQNEFDKMI